MTENTGADVDLDALTGADLRTATFAMSTAFGRGYDQHEVDSFVTRCAAAVDQLRGRLRAATQQIEDLQAQVERSGRSRDVSNAMNVLTTAQRTADKTIAEADGYSTTVMAEARDLYEDARRNAAILEQETEDKARSVYQDAVARSEALERETEQRLADLTMSAVTAQQELDAQTAYLRTLRDATRTQMEAFLEGLLDRVAEEYGKANPLAVEAARDVPRKPRRSTRPGGTKGSTKVNGRPAPQLGRTSGSTARVAGQPGRTQGVGWDGVPYQRSRTDDAGHPAADRDDVFTD
ncbi:DivIVA domain-containing protein [Nakamurella sp. GG22]